MKQSYFFLLFLLLLSLYSTRATRLITPKQGKDTVDDNGLPQLVHSVEIAEEDTRKLMGLEDCEMGDEECLNRRMLSDAHLDYIYTQHHKP